MATDAQIRANRENAKKSTGPTSMEGLARSSQNAARHRMFAHKPVAGPEDEQEFQNLLECLRDQYLPASDIEVDLIQQMADARWRYLRSCEEERALYNLDYRKYGAADPENYDRGEAFIRLSDSGHLKYSRRCQSMFDRKYQKALAELRRIQAVRSNSEREAEDDADLGARYEAQALRELGLSRDELMAQLAAWSTPNRGLGDCPTSEIGFVSATHQKAD